MAETARRIIVRGRVQGVGFRYFVKMHADRLGLNGFVRNRKDGTVEALCAGDEEAVEELVARCHVGPTSSHVEAVNAEPASGIVDKGFSQLPTV